MQPWAVTPSSSDDEEELVYDPANGRTSRQSSNSTALPSKPGPDGSRVLRRKKTTPKLGFGLGLDQYFASQSKPSSPSPCTDSPRASSPRASSPRASSPRASSPRASSPRITSPRVINSYLNLPRRPSQTTNSTPTRASRRRASQAEKEKPRFYSFLNPNISQDAVDLLRSEQKNGGAGDDMFEVKNQFSSLTQSSDTDSRLSEVFSRVRADSSSTPNTTPSPTHRGKCGSVSTPHERANHYAETFEEPAKDVDSFTRRSVRSVSFADSTCSTPSKTKKFSLGGCLSPLATGLRRGEISNYRGSPGTGRNERHHPGAIETPPYDLPEHNRSNMRAGQHTTIACPPLTPPDSAQASHLTGTTAPQQASIPYVADYLRNAQLDFLKPSGEMVASATADRERVAAELAGLVPRKPAEQSSVPNSPPESDLYFNSTHARKLNLLSGKLSLPPTNRRGKSHIFVDMSNIWIGFLNTYKIVHGFTVEQRIPPPAFAFDLFARILERDDPYEKRILAGSCSSPASQHQDWPQHLRAAKRCGYTMNIFDRVLKDKPLYKSRHRGPKHAPHSSEYFNGYRSDLTLTSSDESEDRTLRKPVLKNSEQGVDENLHLHMMYSLYDYINEPGTMVLATGDAAAAEFSDGFKQHAIRALESGWHFELVSWKRPISSAWKDLSLFRKYGDRFRIIELDDFLMELVG